jgi:hypothetical protein
VVVAAAIALKPQQRHPLQPLQHPAQPLWQQMLSLFPASQQRNKAFLDLSCRQLLSKARLLYLGWCNRPMPPLACLKFLQGVVIRLLRL